MLVCYFLLSCHGAPLISSLAQSTLNPAFQYLYTPMSCYFTGTDSPSSVSTHKCKFINQGSKVKDATLD